MIPKRIISLVAFALLSIFSATAAEQFISFNGGDMLLCKTNEKFSICVSDNDNIAVKLAAKNLCTDFQKVIGTAPTLSGTADGCRIIAGTLGSSTIIDQLVKSGIIDAKQLKGKREKYLIIPVSENSIKSLPSLGGAGGSIIIAGSDRRGTVYGIYELSRQIGVSPWYYWMDAPVKQQKAIYVNNHQKGGISGYTDGEPAVRYRGIFLNDEAPCLTSWVKNTFGTGYGDHNFYAKVFELILRLKGNYMWPAMWGWAFYANDPENSKTADDMGVMVGTSHHEPMSRSQQEWRGHTDNPNVEVQDEESRKHKNDWNYATNKANLDYFWQGGVERNKNTEDIITIGMRGDGDMAMSEERNTRLLESVIENQRKIISKVRGKAAKDVPQMWALYKEVQDYYDDGMRVPDDVTILLCDDNWGNIRRVPTAQERKRSGGWGLYYHVDYVGAPRNSKTLNVTPVQNMWEQLTRAYNNGIDRLWILNVGDLKPMEYPIQLFMDMAWNGAGKCTADAEGQQSMHQNTHDFCASLFGEDQASEAARLLELCCKMNGRITPEMLDAKTYNVNTDEWAEVVDDYKTLERDALRQYMTLSEDEKPAYYQLILFPVQVMANLYEMYYAQAMNNALHEKGDAAQNEWADLCAKCFKRDSVLMHQYNKELCGGKWDGMMTQKHIGYTTWQDNFPHDIMPKVYRMDTIQNIFDEDGKGYVAMEAPHYISSNGDWLNIPGIGRTLGGMTVNDPTIGGKATVKGSSLTYKFGCSKGGEKVKVHIITKSTLDYLNKGGMTYSVSLDGCDPVTVNFNSDMNEKPENIYDKYYPTVARRVIEKTIELPLGATADFLHSLTFIPNDPGIILEKIIVDLGGYKQQYLFGKESLRK